MTENRENADDIVFTSSSKRLKMETKMLDASISDMFDDSDIFFLDEDEVENSLDLSNWKRCSVISIEKDTNTFDIILKLKDEISNGYCKCRLQIPWSYAKIGVNDIVSVKAEWSAKYQSYVVSSQNGMIVVSPDFLVSGTSVVGSLFCRRKGVLSDRYRGIDSSNKIMTIGSIVHEIFQVILRKKLRDVGEFRSAMKSILRSKQVMHMLYSCDLSIEEAVEEMDKYIPHIDKFIQQYVVGDFNSKAPNGSFSGVIDEIEDIEENIWCPQMGLKGKIDVSVRVRKRNKFTDKDCTTLPLELKTGRASFSLEHKGQLMLYQMMLTELGKKVDSGLLLYIKEGIMKELKSSSNEQRDLIMLRNELAYYLSKNPVSSNDKNMELPEPINHHSACSNCPYNVICCTYLSRDKDISLSEGHNLKKIQNDVMQHLQTSHIDYFLHWTNILNIEEEETRKYNQIKRLWTDTPEKRKKFGKTIINLEISGRVNINEEEQYLHVLTPMLPDEILNTQSSLEFDLTSHEIDVGDYLIVSTNKRIAVAAGHVLSITSKYITLSLERNLSEKYPKMLFHLDKYETQTSMIFNFTNLGALMDNNSIANNLRQLIIDRQPPKFTKFLPKIIVTRGVDILNSLNKVQQKAVLKALTSDDYMLLKGLPGTGKTHTLVVLIRLFVMIGQSVLITSHTHSAVDNVLIRLKDQLKFMRLGSLSRIAPVLHSHSESVLTENCKTPEELNMVYNQYSVFGVTCLGSSHPLLTKRQFDVCLVDESTQVMQSSVIRPLLSAKKFILVGDPDQLPPVIRSTKAKNAGADESLFKRLDSEEATRVLSLQYRMNKCITKIANDVTYKGNLICANEDIQNATLAIPNNKFILEQHKLEKWIGRTLSTHIDQSVILLDTQNVFHRNQAFVNSQIKNLPINVKNDYEDGKENVQKTLYTNYCEAAVAMYLINILLESGVDGANIGIITPYRVQVDMLKNIVMKFREKHAQKEKFIKRMNIEVNTVDQYQGRDKNVIIYCCTKCNNPEYKLAQPKINNSDHQILDDRRRLTVAITRSKHKLIIIGDVSSLENYTPFTDLFKAIPGISKIALNDGKLGFAWDTVHNLLENILTDANDMIEIKNF